MKKEIAWKKLKYYKDTLRFPSKELGKLNWFQRWGMKQVIKSGLPKYTKKGKKLDWQIRFLFTKEVEIFTGKTLLKKCTDIEVYTLASVDCETHNYDITTGKIKKNIMSSDVTVFDIEDWVKEKDNDRTR